MTDTEADFWDPIEPIKCEREGCHAEGIESTCPYDEDIRGKITYCTCCKYHRQQCMDDI